MKPRLLGMAAMAFAVGPAVYAQGEIKVAEASAWSDKIEIVTVTAQRRVEAAQDVGIALSVLTDKDLADHGVAGVNQLQYMVPNFEAVPAFGSGQPEFRLRGVGFDDYGSNNTSTVGIYLDDVAYPLPAASQGLLFDISRVEVLRGPQGTLYGRNTTGGAVSFVTNRPTEDFSAGLNAEYGSHGEFKSEGYVSGELASALTGRLSLASDQGGTWQKNRDTGEDLGNKNASALRAQAAWRPTETLDFLLEAHWGYDKSQPQGLYRFTAVDDAPADGNHTKTGWGGSPVFASLSGIGVSAKPFRNSVNAGVSLHTDADLGFADLSAISAYGHMIRREYNDWDASSLAYAGAYFDTRASVFSQEIRLASKAGDAPFTWLAGFYYSNEKLDEVFQSDFYDLYGFALDTTYGQTVQSVAAFAQGEYRLTEAWKLVAGVRLEREVRKQTDYITRALYATGGSLVAFGTPSDKAIRTTPWTGKVSLEYRPADKVLLFASAGKGVKSGGFTAYNAPSSEAVAPVKPETLWAFETGVKSAFLDDTVQLNASVFYYDYRNQQIQSAIYVPVYQAIGALVNAAKSHLYGGEVEAQWHLLPDLLLTQTFGYKDGSFDKFDNFLDLTASYGANTAVYESLKGQKIGFPPRSYSGSVSYRLKFAGLSLEPEFDYAFHDKRKPLLTGPTYTIAPYWLANANLTLAPDAGPWQVSLYARNLFDTRYDLERNYFVSTTAGNRVNVAASGEPANFGVRLSCKY
jgi:iron complex outermembrane recepter protein